MRIKWSFIFVFIFPVVLFVAGPSSATPGYSEATGQGCRTCHISAEGGELTETGLEYAASGYVWPPEGGYKVLGPIRKSIRLVVGIFHIVAAFLWFGTILYVHILLRPAYAARGLPRGEVFLGLVSMAVVGVSGVLLTVSRISSLSVLYESTWGIMLSVKVALYLVMVSSALFVVLFVGPKLKRGMTKAVHPKGGVFDPLTLSAFDGKDGRPAYVAYKGKVFDMTDLKLWKNGMHMKHASGSDLTDSLSKAPHGEEKLEPLKIVGSYDSERKPEKTAPQKAFYFIAYMNLAVVFLVLIVIAFWRWGV
ncbi:MAG: cytochrome b5 domain-containing protein [Nitrospirota bacterium]